MNNSSNLPLKAALYARVSSEEQVEGYSIDAQLRAFRQLCESKQWTPYREYVEEGKSARTENINKRPVFKQAMTDGLDRQYDVLVVHKVDRFSRKLRITLEYFDKLAKADVGFVSITEQMDFSSPWGKFALSMLGGLAELYSDNLSQETKKGWNERRDQGLYRGTLPFGATKGSDGVPVPDMLERSGAIDQQEAMVRNYEGLKSAFELGSQGKSDKAVAIALNAMGYRTTGTHGSRPFSKDTIKDILKNRFYLGYIPDGNGGWLPAKHQSFISEELFSKLQEERAKRRHDMSNRVKTKARTYSLSGLIFCKYCGAKVHIHQNVQGKARVYCSTKAKGFTCQSKSTFLEVYEAQIQWYLENFVIPEDYQEKILEAHRKIQSAYNDVGKQKASLEAALGRLGERYDWGHIKKDKYLAEYDEINKQLKQLAPAEEKVKNLDKLARFMTNVADAWKEASQEQRNKLANVLFSQIWIQDSKVVEVRPVEELRPFFRLSYEESLEKSMKRPRGDLNP